LSRTGQKSTATLRYEISFPFEIQAITEKVLYVHRQERERKTITMRYLLAWALGVPGVIVVLWFLVSHH
jgi:hypothetical protein